jgi:hypothetical protein
MVAVLFPGRLGFAQDPSTLAFVLSRTHVRRNSLICARSSMVEHQLPALTTHPVSR